MIHNFLVNLLIATVVNVYGNYEAADEFCGFGFLKNPKKFFVLDTS